MTERPSVGEPFEIDLDELSAEAEAADPDVAVQADAVPLATLLGGDAFGAGGFAGELPAWYMPAPMARGAGRQVTGWRKYAIYAVIVSSVGIHAYGLCNTYGTLRTR